MDAAESIWQDLVWETIQAERWISGKAWLHFHLLSLCRWWGGWRLLPPAGHPCQESSSSECYFGEIWLVEKGVSVAAMPFHGSRGIFASRWSRPLAFQRHWLKQSLQGAVLLQPSSSPCSQQLWSLLPSLAILWRAFSGLSSCSPLAAHSVSWHLPG